MGQGGRCRGRPESKPHTGHTARGAAAPSQFGPDRAQCRSEDYLQAVHVDLDPSNHALLEGGQHIQYGVEPAASKHRHRETTRACQQQEEKRIASRSEPFPCAKPSVS